MTSEKLITMPLRRFLFYSIGLGDKIEVEKEDAIAIQKADKDRTFCHVQFNDLETEKELKMPYIWHIADWNSNYDVHKIKKRKAEERRIQWDIKVKNHAIVAARCRELFFIDVPDSQQMAEIIFTKNDPKAFENLGIVLAVYNESMLSKEKL